MGRILEYSMRKNADSSQHGFSLIEGLIAIAVIGIVLGMAIINFSSIMPNFKANSAMDAILYRLRSAREQAIAHRRNVQITFVGNNQITIAELWPVGVPPPPVTYTFEGGAKFITFGSVPDLPAPYNFGNGAPIIFGGQAGGPPIMQFTTSGAFVDGGNTLLNGTVFLGMPGNATTARAISVLGATGRIREYHWDGTAWQE
jgi:prepilin-type N-terminal cleavage/methylation domain-containing protein